MDITLAIGIISCVIGISTFVSGMVARSKSEGQTVEKINQCIKGIDDIKKDLKEHSTNYATLNGTVIEHAGKIHALEDDVKNILDRLNFIGRERG